MTYLHLLSPDGEPFEVIEQRAGALLTKGWTFNSGMLKDAIARIDETTAIDESVNTDEPQGAVADAQDFANDIPVDVEQEATDAGPEAEEQEANVIDGPASEPVEERKPRRKPFKSDA